MAKNKQKKLQLKLCKIMSLKHLMNCTKLLPLSKKNEAKYKGKSCWWCSRGYSRHCFDFENKLSLNIKHATSYVDQTVAEQRKQKCRHKC